MNITQIIQLHVDIDISAALIVAPKKNKQLHPAAAKDYSQGSLNKAHTSIHILNLSHNTYCVYICQKCLLSCVLGAPKGQ